MAIPTTDIPTPPANIQSGQGIPDGLVLLGTIIVVGGIAQALYAVKPSAGWMFAALAVIGFIAAGDELSTLTKTISTLTGGNKNAG